MSKRHHQKSLSYLPGADMWTLIFCTNDLFAAPGQAMGMLMSPEAGGFGAVTISSHTCAVGVMYPPLNGTKCLRDLCVPCCS